jgi:hypothetical protein
MAEKSVRRSGRNVENFSENIAEVEEQPANNAESCSYPAAGTCSIPADSKTKENKTKENYDMIDDRSINQSCENLKFSDLLARLGLDWYEFTAIEPKSEKDFAEREEDYRYTQKCTIPYYFHSSKKVMVETLRYLSAFSYLFNDVEDTRLRDFFAAVIDSIAEMVREDSVTLAGKRVMYYEIIDRLNEIVRTDYLSEWLVSFEYHWKEVLAGNEIKHPRAYMKACIWNWLKDYSLDNYGEEV